ncbi:MAG: mechanosensitive ion channel [Cardiobacteriaceae bacterium]|nr:mechanosensitive ion channel [Cardiobacteriaceae bacterium]
MRRNNKLVAKFFSFLLAFFSCLLIFNFSFADNLSKEEQQALSKFADVLENPKQRAALVKQLRNLESTEDKDKKQADTKKNTDKTAAKSTEKTDKTADKTATNETKNETVTNPETETKHFNSLEQLQEKSREKEKAALDEARARGEDVPPPRIRPEDEKQNHAKDETVKNNEKQEPKTDNKAQNKKQENQKKVEEQKPQEKVEQKAEQQEKTDKAEEEKSEEEKAENTENTAVAVPPPLEKVTEKVAENTKVAISHAATVPKKIVALASKVGGTIWQRLQASWQAITRIFTGKDYRIKSLQWSDIWQALGYVLAVIFTTVFAFKLVNRLMRKLFVKLDNWSREGAKLPPLLRRVLAICCAVSLDLVNIALASVAGYTLTLYMPDPKQEFTSQAALFLNSFIIVAMLKVCAGALLRHDYSGLRLLPTENKIAAYWYDWFAVVVSLVTYGFLFVVPLVEFHFSYSLSQAVSSLLALGTFIYAVRMVIARQRKVRQAILKMANQSPYRMTRFFLRFVAYFWLYAALLYFVMLLYITLQTSQKQALALVLRGTFFSFLVLIAGYLLTSTASTVIHKKFSIRKMPLLSAQINTYIPLLMHLLRFTVIAAVIASLFAIWGVADVMHWFRLGGRTLMAKLNGIIFILSLAVAVRLIFYAIIEPRLNTEGMQDQQAARRHTLLTLARNAFDIFMVAFVLVMVLSEIGINLGPLIAGAGVLGLAIGFGAQTLVKDVITGIFLQLENAINTNDYVKVDGISGWAERISIRSITIRDINGISHLIPFSSVTIVSNYMRDFAYHTEEYGIGYNEDIDHAIAVMGEAFAELIEGDCKYMILDNIDIQGVVSFGDSAVNIRVRIKTLPGKQWAVGRAYNRLLKIYFDRAGIEIPYPHQTLYFGADKQGQANPIFVAKTNTKAIHTPQNADKTAEKPSLINQQVLDKTTNKGQIAANEQNSPLAETPSLNIEKTADGAIKVNLPSGL